MVSSKGATTAPCCGRRFWCRIAVLLDGTRLRRLFHPDSEIERRLAGLGIRLVPIMVDPSSVVEPQARRFGIETPILIDSDRSVSEAYDMLGI